MAEKKLDQFELEQIRLEQQLNEFKLMKIKTEQEMLSELSRRHNWEQQEKHWQRQGIYWACLVVVGIAAIIANAVVAFLK